MSRLLVGVRVLLVLLSTSAFAEDLESAYVATRKPMALASTAVC